MDYRLRTATPADEAWQLAIYAGTRTDELALTGWPRGQCERFVAMQHRAQQQHYLQHFPQAVCQLILVGEGEVAGRLWVDRSPAEALHVLDIALLPAWRGQGIGTHCLEALAREADACHRALGIHVEIHNPARRLYERLGFVADGEPQGLHQAMRRPACRPHHRGVPAMINKRDFLKGGATAIVASAGTPAALASVRPSLGDQAGLASWQAHVGQHFEVDGHAVTLRAVTALPGLQAGEQFSLSFAGPLPAGVGDGLHTLTREGGAAQTLYLARTPLGLRADFCRLQG